MRRILSSVVLTAFSSSVWVPGAAADPAPPGPPAPPPFVGPNAVAQIYPYEGHQGDSIYLAGRGFRPNSQLTFLLACPEYRDKQVYQLHNYVLEYGPTTRPDGSFAAYRLKQKLFLHGVSSSSCLLYVNYPDRPASDFPAPYYVVPGDRQLPKCVRQICARVRVRAVQQHGKPSERIMVQTIGSTWVGATAIVSVTYPHLRPLSSDKQYRTLNFSGSTSVLIPLRGDAPQHVQGTVHVSFRLGPTKGNQLSRFTVVHR